MLVKEPKGAKDAKADLFKPKQPRIPGVAPVKLVEPEPQPTPAPDPQPGNAPPPVSPQMIIGVAVMVLALVLGLAWLRNALASNHRVRSAPSTPAPEAVQAEAAPPPLLPAGPGPVATTEELAQPWAAKKFSFKNALTGEFAPAMVVHIPGGSYWAFSLEEPFGKCEMEFVTDTARLHSQFNFVADHPMVVDSCNSSVFDLLRYGAGPKGLVRGEVAQGSAIRPPVAIEVRVDGRQIVAVRAE